MHPLRDAVVSGGHRGRVPRVLSSPRVPSGGEVCPLPAVLGLALSPGSGLCPHPQVPLGISVGQAGVHVHGSQGT